MKQAIATMISGAHSSIGNAAYWFLVFFNYYFFSFVRLFSFGV